MAGAFAYQRLRRRQPLLRGPGRLHPPHRPRSRPRAMQWAEHRRPPVPARGRQGEQASSRTPPSTRWRSPAASTSTSAAGTPRASSIREIFGDLEPINPAYRSRDARLAVMDTQNLEATFMFPTLGVGMEEALKDDPEAMLGCLPGLQPLARRRLGLRVQEPHLHRALHHAQPTLDWALAELDWALDRGAPGMLVMRSAPGQHRRTGNKSPGRRALRSLLGERVAEAGISVAFHSGDAGYNKPSSSYWGMGQASFKSFDYRPSRHVHVLGTRSTT